MKKYILIIVVVLINYSCSLDDGGSNTSHQLLPIESIELPDEFVLNQQYYIDFTFIRPTNCHAYEGLFLKAENEVRVVAVQSVVYSGATCEELTEDNIVSKTFVFDVMYDQTYVFRIWKGIDSSGEEVYEEIEVPVVN